MEDGRLAVLVLDLATLEHEPPLELTSRITQRELTTLFGTNAEDTPEMVGALQPLSPSLHHMKFLNEAHIPTTRGFESRMFLVPQLGPLKVHG